MKHGTKLGPFLKSTTNSELAKIFVSISDACKAISRLVNNAGISDIIGHTGSTNVQGESVQKLDDLSNKILMDYLTASEICAGYLSEENEGVMTLNESGTYTVAVDPLDGSSNIDVCAPIGTIFSINERLSETGEPVNEIDFLQKGSQTKAAGYVIYGSSTILMFSTGSGLNAFTLNTEDNEFYLSHSDIQIPPKGKIYSINQGNSGKFDQGLINYLEYCLDQDKATSRPYSLRYIGSMVADLHRTLLKGGIFIYPANKGESKGKLRLLYECIPMSFMAEQAGGKATDGKIRILDIHPAEVHERTAIFIGSKDMVEKAMKFIKAQ